MEKLIRKSINNSRRVLRIGHGEDNIMRQKSLRMIAMLASAAVMLLGHVAPTYAQLDEVRKVNWETAKKLFPEIVEAAKDNPRKAFERMNEFKVNLDIIQDKVERAGASLHEQDRSWLASTSKEKVVDKCKKLKIEGGMLQVALSDFTKDSSSAISSFKSAWEEFSNPFEQLWREFQARAKELDDRMKLFRAECKECF